MDHSRAAEMAQDTEQLGTRRPFRFRVSSGDKKTTIAVTSNATTVAARAKVYIQALHRVEQLDGGPIEDARRMRRDDD